MTDGFVIDESSWIRVDSNDPNFIGMLRDFIALLDEVRDKQISLYRHADIYNTLISSDMPIYTFLWEVDHGDSIDNDDLEFLRIALDRCQIIDEDEFQLEDYEAVVAGVKFLSPGLCWAHLRSKYGVAVSPVALPINGAVNNKIQVNVAGCTQELFFTFEPNDIKKYFRYAAIFEGFDEASLSNYAEHAFPKLYWTNAAWQGLKVHKGLILGKHYHDAFNHLCVLNDLGCDFFSKILDNDEISRNFAANGVDASTENGRTRQNNECKAARTKKYQDKYYEFWWHTKLSWDVGRIHFRHFPSEDGDGLGFIVIGLITDHAYLPG